MNLLGLVMNHLGRSSGPLTVSVGGASVQVYQYGDLTLPAEFASEAFRGGDEDYVVVAWARHEDLFLDVADMLDSYSANHVNRDHVCRFRHGGQDWLLYTVCHA